MEVIYSQRDFENLLRGSFKHGWLQKRNNSLRSIRKQKRYFVLCNDCLHWFKKEKTRFVQKGACELVDMKLTDWTAESLQIERKSTGKVYRLTGGDIKEWTKTLAATIAPFTNFPSTPKELKLAEYSNETASSTKSNGKSSRKSTGTNSGLSSALSSLPNSAASSFLDGESNPPTPQAGDDLEDSSSLDEKLIGRPILTKETLEKHNSTMESFQMDGDTYRVDITPCCDIDDEKSEKRTTPKAEAPAVKNAISFFEQLSDREEELPRTKSARTRQRIFSKFGPETKGRLRTSKRSPAAKVSIGGEELPSEVEHSIQFGDSESSLLSEGLARANLQGTRTLDDLTHSLANMMDILDSLNDRIESQTQTNLLLFERGCSLRLDGSSPPDERRRIVSTTSDSCLLERAPTTDRGGALLDLPDAVVAPSKSFFGTTSDTELFRIPSDRDCDLLRKQSSYRLSIDYRARSPTLYTARKSAMSLVSLQTADTDSVSSIPDVDDIEMDERFADIEEYIHSKLIFKEPISMVELTCCFKGKRLPKEAFRKLYQKIRKRIEIDQRISRRQPENLSQLSLLYGHFVDLHSGEIEEKGAREIIRSKYITEKISQDELIRIKEDMLIPMEFQEFSGFIGDLPLEVGFQFRLGLEEHVKAKTPLRRVNLRLSEVKLIDFAEDGLTVERSSLACVQKGWSLMKLGGETVFTSEEKDDFLDDIEDVDETFNLDFMANVKK